jgi:hypothetical protein
MPLASSPSTGPTCLATVTCEPSLPPTEIGQSISSAAGSRAKTSALQARVQGSPGQGLVFGTSLQESFAKLAPDGSLWKTSAPSLLGDSEPFSKTWPASGLMRNGTAYQLVPLVRRTAGNESGLWRTPSAQEPGVKAERLTSREPSGQARHYDKETGRLAQIGLSQQVQLRAMYPTPSASQMPCEGTVRLARQRWLAGDCTLEEASAIAGRDVRDKQGKVPAMWPTPKASAAGPDFAKTTRSKTGISLATAAAMYPTPTVQDASNNGGPSQYGRNSLPLNAVAGGALNPTWVEWLMGFPLGWTDLGDSATPSSRKSSKSSGGRSSKRKPK